MYRSPWLGGAGKLKKLIGTNASDIVTSSPVPVFAIPKGYRTAPISNVFYSSDLNDLRWELKQVINFARSIKDRVSVYHYDYLFDVKETQQKLKKVADKFKAPGVKFIFQKLNLEHTLARHLKRDFRKSKASIAVLFTNQSAAGSIGSSCLANRLRFLSTREFHC